MRDLLVLVGPPLFTSNLKDKIDKSKISKFGNNIKDILGDMSPNYTIIVYKYGSHEDYVIKICRALLFGPNPALKLSIKHIKDKPDTGTEAEDVDLIQNATEKYNNMVAAKEFTKMDQKDANILALTTRFHTSLRRVDLLLLTHTRTVLKQIIRIHQTGILL